jgi:acetyltransferase
MASFSEETTAILKKTLPNTANIKNPVDVIGDARADRYNSAISAAFNDEGTDGVFVILTPQSMTNIEEIAHEVVKVSGKADKPIYASFMGESDVAAGIDILQRNKIPHYILPESMTKSFAAVYGFNHELKGQEDISVPEDIDRDKAQEIVSNAQARGQAYLTETEAVEVLQTYGLPIPGHGFATDEDQAVEAARKIGFPVVMKIMSHDIVHKFDVGGTALNIDSEEKVRQTFRDIMSNVKKNMPEAKIDGIYLAKMIERGEEVILGAKRDPSFGPVIMFGLGGIYVEIFKDVSFRVAPFGEQTALDMIREIKAYPILSGARGTKPRDIPKLQDALIRLGQLINDIPAISELDINPMIVLEAGQGCFVADAKIMLQTEE